MPGRPLSARLNRNLARHRERFDEASIEPGALRIELALFIDRDSSQTYRDRLRLEANALIPTSDDDFACSGWSIKGLGSSWAFDGSQQREYATLIGDTRKAERYVALAAAAGASLPVELRPPVPTFEGELQYERCGWESEGIWTEFVFTQLIRSGSCAAFEDEVDWPKDGCRIRQLKICPFLGSVMAIDEVLYRIPPDKRTRPISLRKAGNYLGMGNTPRAAESVKKMIEDGTLECESLTRQSHVFSLDEFPESSWSLLRPKRN